MSVEWPEYSLGDLLEITSSKRIFRSDYVDDGVPFFRSKEVIERANGNEISTELFITRKKYQEIKNKFGSPIEGDILLTSVGTLGISYQVDKKDEFYFKDGNLTWFRNFSDKISSRYLLYWLRSPTAKHAFEMITIGSTQKALTIVSLKKIKINLPDIDTQLGIVKILDSIEGKLNNNRQINQTLEQIAQAIFKSWFVDFDPVKAKITAKQNDQDPERAAMCSISGKTDEELDQLSPEQRQQLAATAALFPDALVDSELGEIPEGWEISAIGDEVDVVGGGTPSTKNKEYWDGGEINWTTPKDLSGLQDKVLIKTEKQITDAGLDKISSGLLPVDTVLMSSRAPVGYLAQAKIPVAINQGYIAMKCNKRLSPGFVLLWADSVMDEIKQRAGGSTFAEISKKNFRPITVLVPDSEVMSVFQSQVKIIYDKITECILENESLSNIRDLLLPKLLSGEIIIGDIQL